MFSVDELLPCTSTAWFKSGYQLVERLILQSRLGLSPRSEESQLDRQGLVRFCQAVLASAPAWASPREGDARELCIAAADIESGLAIWEAQHKRKELAHEHFLRSAILYDLGGMPGTAATLARRNGLDKRLADYFARARESIWGNLVGSGEDYSGRLAHGSVGSVSSDLDELFETALAETVTEYGRLFQEDRQDVTPASSVLEMLLEQAGRFTLRLDSDQLSALQRSLQLRRENTTLPLMARHSELDANVARSIGMPLELWPVQRRALETGLLSKSTLSYGLAAPTGTGKTSLTRALIASAVADNPARKIIYVCPSRALVHQVSKDLNASLKPAGIQVKELGAHLTVHEQLASASDDAQVLVFTPERADLLMRVDPDFIHSVGLVIVDEAHHIEQGSRGILLEFYLWRLRKLVPHDARIVQLSAVTPNIGELVDWLSDKESCTSVKVDWRTNRLRLGVFERRRDGSGVIKFESGAPFTIFEPQQFPTDRVAGIALLAERLSTTGVVLVLSTSVGGAEEVAEYLAELRESVDAQPTDQISERLDARIERELYPEAPLRNLLKRRIAYHHAQLPPSVRAALEEAIAARKVDVVCATTTLAEGVNFPFSTVLVESLVGRNYQLTPRSLWNIAGRAGRFGVDSEGHCIIFEPGSFENKLVGFQLRDYLRTKLDDIPPVRSALATGLAELKDAVERLEISSHDLSSVELGRIAVDGKPTSSKSKKLRGLVNLVRVGYTHANTSKLISLDDDSAPELTRDVLAARQVDESVRAFATDFGMQQRRVIKEAFADRTELMEIAARIGWALETQSELHEWLRGLPNWRIENLGKIVVGGRILVPDHLGYVLGPVSKLMSEFEGDKLGGFTSYIARGWIEGLPLTGIRDSQKEKDLGNIVKVIYARVQYLLPWALYGLNDLIEYEAKQRKIRVLGGVRDLSVLAAEGVPSFDALHLVLSLGIERVDASRIAAAYRRISPHTDAVGFFIGLDWNTLVGVLRGPDRRRLDPDMRMIWETARQGGTGAAMRQ
jgi:superfamily II DNA/RNA helicase